LISVHIQGTLLRLPEQASMLVSAMKCRPLRRRYVTFRTSGSADDHSIIEWLSPHLQPESKAKVVLKEGQFVVVRIDQVSLKSLRQGSAFPITASFRNATLTSLFAAGSVKKSRERIKAFLE